MNLKGLFEDDDAVAPVIGILLLVAIAVILAAIIGPFVIGLTEQTKATAPNAQFDFEFDDGSNDLTITHTGGDKIEAQELYVTGDVNNPDDSWADKSGYTSDTVSNRDEMKVEGSGASGNYYEFSDSSVPPGTTVRLVWKSAEGERSATLDTWEK